MQLAETCVPGNDVQLITAALPQTACDPDAQAVVPMLDQLEQGARLPAELVADTLYTGDENVQAAAARSVDLVGPVPGRAPAADPAALTVDDFAYDERTGTITACPAGHRPTSCAHDVTTATTRVEMPASACGECPFRKQCPIERTRDGKFTLEFTDKERRLAGRRAEEKTKVFQERYAPRSGIESTNSGLKNRLRLGRLRVRGRGSVFRVILHKVAGWNVLRAAASKTLRAWVRTQVAQTLNGRESGSTERLFALVFRLWDGFPMVSWGSHAGPQGLAALRRLSKNQRPLTRRLLSVTSHLRSPTGPHRHPDERAAQARLSRSADRRLSPSQTPDRGTTTSPARLKCALKPDHSAY